MYFKGYLGLDFSVAICTYNGERRLPEVLERLRFQIGAEALVWEIIVVDNNSSDHTARVIKTIQKDWGNRVSLRYYYEPEPGVSYARRRAVLESRSGLIGFLDDDNLAFPRWVAEAVRFGSEHPLAGGYGSQIHADIQRELPRGFEKILPFFAVVEFGSQPILWKKKNRILPPGAGLVIRKTAFLKCSPPKIILRGRIANNEDPHGEDMELLAHIQKGGWEIWYRS